MTNGLKKIEETIDRKLRYQKRKRQILKNLKIITSLGWIFITPIIMFIFLGDYLKRFFKGYEIAVMIIFIASGTLLSCINIIYVVKNIYRENYKV